MKASRTGEFCSAEIRRAGEQFTVFIDSGLIAALDMGAIARHYIGCFDVSAVTAGAREVAAAMRAVGVAVQQPRTQVRQQHIVAGQLSAGGLLDGGEYLQIRRPGVVRINVHRVDAVAVTGHQVLGAGLLRDPLQRPVLAGVAPPPEISPSTQTTSV
jgi:hypothetical protein